LGGGKVTGCLPSLRGPLGRLFIKRFLPTPSPK
jgi:hypothetical protein